MATNKHTLSFSQELDVNDNRSKLFLADWQTIFQELTGQRRESGCPVPGQVAMAGNGRAVLL